MNALSMVALLATVLLASVPAACAATPFGDEADAPQIRAKLLALGQAGGAGDQWLVGADFAPGSVTFRSEKGFKVVLALGAGDTVTASITGSTRSQQTPGYARRPYTNGGTLEGGISYGFRQVDRVQQQPFLAGKGWSLWGWSYAQVKAQELMADGRIRLALWMPNGNILAVGWCDGGNTVLHRAPRDITRKSPFMGYVFGGGRGSSTLLTEVTPQGEPLHQAFLGTAVGDFAWDRWGRVYLAGSNMSAGGVGSFGRPSSGSVLVLSRDLRRPLFDTRLGGTGTSYKDNAWTAVDLDEEQGLLALSGWTAQQIESPENSVQDASGGDKDGMYALIRLWPAATAPTANRGMPPPASRPPETKPPRPNPFQSQIRF
jgi:hypothetical protein